MNDIQAKNRLQSHVDQIAENLTIGLTFEQAGFDAEEFQSEPDNIISGYDYLSDALDIQYIVDGEGNYIAARILVAFGGPNIWINTQTKTVEGYWYGDSAFASYYDDAMNIDEACNEIWGCK